jgi:hypothetical protein
MLWKVLAHPPYLFVGEGGDLFPASGSATVFPRGLPPFFGDA